MSTAKDEAEEGPDSSGEDGSEEHASSASVADGHSQEVDIHSSETAKANGVRAHLAVGQEPTQESDNETPNANERKSRPQQGANQDLKRPSSADGSLSIPDDTPSAQGSVISSSLGRGGRISSYGRSPTPSLRPFDRRFQARASPSPRDSPRASSPAFHNLHSRQSSATYTIQDIAEAETLQAPWEVVRWTKLRKMTGQAFSEVGKRNFGRPTCIAIAASIVLGTSKGIILVFDYNQNLKSIIGPGTKAVESGSITSISLSADHSTVAAGHATGNIFTWEVAKTAKPFLHIPPVNRNRSPNSDGHVSDVAILHIGFLGMRHTALASADDQGMAFSHIATRGMGVVTRSVKTTRILGRYPDANTKSVQQRKPSSVLSFASLPFGNAEHTADSMGLVALLTPYLLVIVSTTPIAQTQYKVPRPKEVAAHGAMTAALAWFPSVKLKVKDPVTSETSSRVKLVYCWSNILTVLDVVEAEPSANGNKEDPPSLQFRPRSRWKAEEAIVGVQWLARSVLAVLTITQQLVILEDPSMTVTDSSDLIQKHIYHADLFSPQLNQLVDQLEDEEVAAMHGVVADAFYMSFRAYKGRLFLLGYNEISFGTLSNWADRLLALMEEGSYTGAIRLATSYYSGEANKVAVGLPEDDDLRHAMVQEKLLEMMSASLNYAFGRSQNAEETRVDRQQLEELAAVCVTACVDMNETDFLFEKVYEVFQDGGLESILIESLEQYIVEDDITVIPPTVIKDLVGQYTARRLNARLEEMICHLDLKSMDLDQITKLCEKNHLYDALLYVWNQALGDYTTILNNLLTTTENLPRFQPDVDTTQHGLEMSSASKIFPYLSYILTSRVYPTGLSMPADSAAMAKAELYTFFFSGSTRVEPSDGVTNPPSRQLKSNTNLPNLRRILNFDAPSFLSILNEAFEDNFLNGPQDRMTDETPGRLTEEQKFGLSVNRQWIVSILLEVMAPPAYDSDDTVYLHMFIARNLPKFPQFILLPGHVLHRVLVGLCEYTSEDVAEDCQLSVEYLLSMYQPPDLSSLIPLISKARFYRVLKYVYRSEKQYADLLKTYFEDYENIDAIFDCIRDCLRPGAGLSEKQINEFRKVIVDHAYDLPSAGVQKAASTIDAYAPDLHSVLLDSLSEDDGAQFQYLQTILESSTAAENEVSHARHSKFTEQYVRLLCDHDPAHVSEYIEHLEAGNLRLEEILPALESSGVIDAAVVLMAREGKVREGIDRLTQHLNTLESALLGLLEGVHDSPDAANTAETAKDLVSSVQKYGRVGVWLCQRQTKAVEKSKPKLSRAKSAKALNDALSSDEELWLDLIDSIVTVTKNVTGVLGRHERQAAIGDERPSLEEPSSPQLDSSSLTSDLRTTVQEVFTALLVTTSAPHSTTSDPTKVTPNLQRTDISFLRILRAFLNRASLSSPSLSNLRAVLAAIFSAYSYEESLLSLANRLLDKDLFVHVAEADTLRRRGWRPKGQVCEGCGAKVWGPGAGGGVWDAWLRANEERESGERGRRTSVASRSSSREGKGKEVKRRNEGEEEDDDIQDRIGPDGKGGGAVVVFSCRHMFHRDCLIKTDDVGAKDVELVCPLCI